MNTEQKQLSDAQKAKFHYELFRLLSECTRVLSLGNIARDYERQQLMDQIFKTKSKIIALARKEGVIPQ